MRTDPPGRGENAPYNFRGVPPPFPSEVAYHRIVFHQHELKQRAHHHLAIHAARRAGPRRQENARRACVRSKVTPQYGDKRLPYEIQICGLQRFSSEIEGLEFF